MIDAIPYLALVVSILAFAWPIYRDWRHNGRASLEVRMETYKEVVFEGSKPWDQTRLIVKNHGPARARNVALDPLIGSEGDDVAAVGRLDVPLLHPGQEHHVMVIGEWQAAPLERVTVRWNDSRRRRQSVEVWLSPQRIVQ